MHKEGFEKVAISVSDRGVVTLPVQIDSLPPADYLFDTGTGVTLLSKKNLSDWHLKHDTGAIKLQSMTLNPLNLSFQQPIKIHSVKAMVMNLSSMTKVSHVVGILGLSEMIKAHAVILPDERIVYMKSS